MTDSTDTAVWQPLTEQDIQHQIASLEQLTDCPTLVIATSHLDMALLPPLYERLSDLEPNQWLNVVLYIRGGEVNAARRMALLLKHHAPQLRFIIPFHCESAGTLLSLVADEIVAGPMSMFSPIDPHLHAEAGDNTADSPGAMSAEDIRQFSEVMENWFHLEPQSAAENALTLLSGSIFPTTMTGFYRATEEVKMIATELLARRQNAIKDNEAEQLVSHLLHGFYSHSYAITDEELQALGLNIVTNKAVERVSWKIGSLLNDSFGGSSRQAAEDEWADIYIADKYGCSIRRQRRQHLVGSWHQVSW